MPLNSGLTLGRIGGLEFCGLFESSATPAPMRNVMRIERRDLQIVDTVVLVGSLPFSTSQSASGAQNCKIFAVFRISARGDR